MIEFISLMHQTPGTANGKSVWQRGSKEKMSPYPRDSHGAVLHCLIKILHGWLSICVMRQPLNSGVIGRGGEKDEIAIYLNFCQMSGGMFQSLLSDANDDSQIGFRFDSGHINNGKLGPGDIRPFPAAVSDKVGQTAVSLSIFNQFLNTTIVSLRT